MSEPDLYSDGLPIDKISYREYKILLRPERFFAAERLEEYWNVICRIADKQRVGVTTNRDAFQRHVREVLFYDTADFDLYNNRFILRKRTFYVNGWPETDHELAIKFRHPDLATAAAVNVHPNLPGISRIKFKEEILPLRDRIGGMRCLYSHNCVLTSPNVVLTQGLEDIETVFPALSQIPGSGKKLELVNDLAVEEVQVNVGSFHFGHQYDAKATVAIWRNRASETSLVGEFAFQAKFQSVDKVHKNALQRSEDFYCAVQSHAPDWVKIGTTKTAMIYGLGPRKVANHE